jgi:hypothetical protein
MKKLQAPNPFFLDASGDALDAGYVFVGTAGANAETNQLTVYWDEAGTQPAAQPLRTSNGYIVNGVTRARVFVDADDFSMIVKNRHGVVVDVSDYTSGGIADGSITIGKLDTSTQDKINGALQRTGGTMTGAIVLSGDASAALNPVTKQQMDATIRADLAGLTVSTSASALIGTFPAENLSFRSSTLSSGAVNVRSYGGGSLTVPAGATLGSVNGVASRLMWGLLDFGGSLEPFVVNLSGAVNLDETTLISTTAITASSNNAGIIYSQSARTSVPFRIRGFCDITQATAGIWLTAPSLVQGAGGQSMSAMASLGFGQRWQNLSGSRTPGTTYYNTTGRPIYIAISALSAGTDSSASISVNGAVVIQQFVRGPYNEGASVSAVIPPGASYTASATAILSSWFELR